MLSWQLLSLVSAFILLPITAVADNAQIYLNPLSSSSREANNPSIEISLADTKPLYNYIVGNTRNFGVPSYDSNFLLQSDYSQIKSTEDILKKVHEANVVKNGVFVNRNDHVLFMVDGINSNDLGLEDTPQYTVTDSGSGPFKWFDQLAHDLKEARAAEVNDNENDLPTFFMVDCSRESVNCVSEMQSAVEKVKHAISINPTAPVAKLIGVYIKGRKSSMSRQVTKSLKEMVEELSSISSISMSLVIVPQNHIVPFSLASAQPQFNLISTSAVVTFPNASKCTEETKNCTSRGECKPVKPGDNPVFKCVCAKPSKDNKYKYFTGSACQYEDVSIEFVLLLGTAIVLIILTIAVVVMLLGLGSSMDSIGAGAMMGGSASGGMKSD